MKIIKPEIKEAVRVLFVEKGYKPLEIAKLTGLDHSTIYDWINNNHWKGQRMNKQFKLTCKELAELPVKEPELETKKIKAKALIKSKGYSQKEAAKIVGVSEKTMSQWVRKYDWKPANLRKKLNK